jgi:hypothetical protein
MRLTHFYWTLLLMLPAGAANAAASQNSAGVPVLGLAYDSRTSAIRPILGIPGAAILGDAIEFGFPIEAAVISPRNNLALAVARDRSTRVVQFQAGISSSHRLDGAMTSPSRIVFSPSGSTAILYQQASRRLQLITGLPGNPSVEDVSPSGVPESANATAVSDDGRSILFSSPGPAAQVWLVPVNGNPQLLPFPGSLLSFRPNSSDALSATAAGDVYLVRDVTVSADYRQIYAGSGTSDAVALSFSPDGTLGYVAASSGILTIIDLASGASNTTDCRCAPTVLQPMNTAPVFRVSEISGAPVILFEGSTAAPRTWFVPAVFVSGRSHRPIMQGGGQ